MSYERFQETINNYIIEAAVSLAVKFALDREKQRYEARISDGTTITGHPSGNKLTVRYGSGHQMMKTV